MCGIAGYFGKGNEDVLSSMIATLHHRGPDDSGIYVNGSVGLSQSRLKILDLSTNGYQPMTNEDGSVCLVFNGEIYNFNKLRARLNSSHKFKSKTDTEVIVHLYEEIGERVFEELIGMFSIAIYDKKKNCLILARDHLGKKPLYWSHIKNNLIFGSEVKALLKYPVMTKELDLASLNKYLIYEYVPTPHSIFKNIFKLEPGHYLKYENGQVEKKKFWDITFETDESKNLESAIIGLDSIMKEAVADRLVSDVPLGVFLSGGLDSSAIAYYAMQLSKQKIKTFSVGFEEQSFDESKYARQVAKFLGTDHYEARLSGRDCLDIVPRLADILDEPLADPSIVPTYLLSKFAKENITVALSGDGGDELFCGYDTFRAHRLADFYEKVPEFLRHNIINKVARNLPTSFNNISFDFKIKKFVSGFDGEKIYRHQRWLGSFDDDQRMNLFSSEASKELGQKNVFEDIDNYVKGLKNKDYYAKLIYLYLRTYMMDDILVKVDRASMFNSLEVRSPLLDRRLVEYINNLPFKFKMHGMTTKYVFKKLMEDKLPKNIVHRKKKGFGMPIADWINGDLRDLVLEYLNEHRIKEQKIFNHNFITNILNDHFESKKDNRKLIWTLLTFQMWYYKWL